MSANKYYCPFCHKEITGNQSLIRHISLRSHEKRIVDQFTPAIQHFEGQPPSHYNKQQKYNYYIKKLREFAPSINIISGDKYYEVDSYEIGANSNYSFPIIKREYENFYLVHSNEELDGMEHDSDDDY